MAGWLRRRAARVPRPPRRSSRRAGPRPRVDAPESAPQDCSFDCDRIVLRAAPADHFLPINFIALARVSSAAREICRCINDTSGRRILHGLILFSPPAVSSLHVPAPPLLLKGRETPSKPFLKRGFAPGIDRRLAAFPRILPAIPKCREFASGQQDADASRDALAERPPPLG
jgi:hypothetical protein